MKIAQYINSKDPGGAETLVVQIANELTEEKIDNCIIHHGNRWIEENHDGEQLVIDEYPISQMFTRGLGFGKLLTENEITLLHSHLYGATLRGAVAAKRAGIPHIATQHDVYTILEKPSRIRWLKAAELLGTELVAVSDHMASTYREVANDFRFCQLRNLSPLVIYNGVEVNERFQPARTKTPDKKFTIICVGRLVDVKNQQLLINAFDEITRHGDQMEDARIQFVGDGPDLMKLESLVAGKVLDDRIEFLGQRSDIPELLQQADLFVLPSKSEGLSCSIIEAMACGLPILATDVGGNSELVHPETNGWLVQPNSVEAMAYALLNAYQLRHFLNDQGHASREIAVDLFSIDEMMNNYIEMYYSVQS